MPKSYTSMEMTLNYDAIKRLLWDLGEEGLREALEVMEARAKKHAPVRDVFQSNSNRRAEAVPRVRQDSIGRTINRRYNTPKRQQQFLARVRSQAPKQRRLGGETKKGSGKGGVYGNSRGYSPVLGKRPDGIQAESGRTLRQAGISDTGRVGYKDVPLRGGGVGNASGYAKGGELARIQKQVDFLRQRAGLKVADIRREYESASLSRLRKENQDRTRVGLKPRVPTRQEAAKARLLRKTALHVSASGDVTVGGRLRDEIFTGEIVKEGAVMYGEVIAPTEYAKYQEYGTSHHRAQPFMRPALYEMRNRFPVIVKRALRKGSARKRV